ncbi:hypothetical protein ERO13_D01G163750v2 [Gossypium hirsutum]|nr:hypothetical protein ERO13_D01G163750v2 [Gossypium hirsutum]
MRTHSSTILLHFFPSFQLGPNFSHPLHWSIPPTCVPSFIHRPQQCRGFFQLWIASVTFWTSRFPTTCMSSTEPD